MIKHGCDIPSDWKFRYTVIWIKPGAWLPLMSSVKIFRTPGFSHQFRWLNWENFHWGCGWCGCIEAHSPSMNEHPIIKSLNDPSCIWWTNLLRILVWGWDWKDTKMNRCSIFNEGVMGFVWCREHLWGSLVLFPVVYGGKPVSCILKPIQFLPY